MKFVVQKSSVLQYVERNFQMWFSPFIGPIMASSQSHNHNENVPCTLYIMLNYGANNTNSTLIQFSLLSAHSRQCFGWFFWLLLLHYNLCHICYNFHCITITVSKHHFRAFFIAKWNFSYSASSFWVKDKI